MYRFLKSAFVIQDDQIKPYTLKHAKERVFPNYVNDRLLGFMKKRYYYIKVDFSNEKSKEIYDKKEESCFSYAMVIKSEEAYFPITTGYIFYQNETSASLDGAFCRELGILIENH